MKPIIIGILFLMMGACAKNNDYTPIVDATGEDNFKTACIECHQTRADGYYFVLDNKMATITAISNKISQGSFSMPAFSNIQGESLHELSEYVLRHSKVD